MGRAKIRQNTNRNYLGTMGIENGMIVFVTSGTFVPDKASVTVELIS
jgi:hypothetical protein